LAARGARSAAGQIRRIGYLDMERVLPSGGLHLSTTPIGADPFLEGLLERAGSEGQNVTMSDGLRRARQIGSGHLPQNLLPLDVDVMLAAATPAAQAAQNATSRIAT